MAAQQGSADFNGTGSLSAIAVLANKGLSVFAGSGQLLVNAIILNTAHFSGTGNFSLVAFIANIVFFGGSGLVSISTTQNNNAFVTFHGNGKMCPYAQRFLGAIGAMSNSVVIGPGATENVVV